MYSVVATGVPASYSACVKLTTFRTTSEPVGSLAVALLIVLTSAPSSTFNADRQLDALKSGLFVGNSK